MGQHSFQEVMQQWARMCGRMRACEECPLEKAGIETTEVCVNGIMSFDYKGAEPIIMSWATEHPEAVYPTWGEWLMKQGVISGLAPGRAFDGNGGLKQRIPEYIAEKLGIDPKEG